MMKIYTKKGDGGETSLIGGTRVTKGHFRIEAYGSVDELNSHLGMVLSDIDPGDAAHELLRLVQSDLFVMGSLLAADPAKSRMQLPPLEHHHVEMIEQAIDDMNERLSPLTSFILPSGSPEVARCHVARCVCRRAERAVVRLSDEVPVDPVILEYINRLSDLLFVLARRIASDKGVQEVYWQPRR